jgi:DNA-binding ferritin-like protein (Dps family)
MKLKKLIENMVRDEMRNLNENTWKGSVTNLLEILEDAINIAEKAGNDIETHRDVAVDDPMLLELTEKLEDLLKQIYNAYITGDRSDDVSDEIF